MPKAPITIIIIIARSAPPNRQAPIAEATIRFMENCDADGSFRVIVVIIDPDLSLKGDRGRGSLIVKPDHVGSYSLVLNDRRQ